MNSTRFAVKAIAGTIATTVIVIGSLSAPAVAKKDTGWGKVADPDTAQTMKRDTGWG